jgi:hypothetical protein
MTSAIKPSGPYTYRSGGRMAAAQERDLLRCWLTAGDATARDRLVERMLPFVKRIAQSFAGRGEPVDDLVQLGRSAFSTQSTGSTSVAIFGFRPLRHRTSPGRSSVTFVIVAGRCMCLAQFKSCIRASSRRRLA